MGYRPKKSLGQNFLKSQAALQKIIGAGEISSDDIILEIGPGKGALTEKLLEKAGQVISVEKDRELFELLKIKFAQAIEKRSLVLVHEDIMNFNARTYDLKTRTYKVIANIPYNITGAILKKFLTAENQPERMVLMVQKEVAQRIIARDNKESILSISVKAYGTPEMVMKVPARYFSPAPKVDSAVIAVKNISRTLFRPSVQSSTLHTKEKGVDEEKFWEIVRAGFAHKRKKLSSNLKKLLKYQGEPLVKLVGDKRAEELGLEDWIALAKMVQF